MFDERRMYHHIDWLLLGAVLCLTMIGLAMIYSTTVNPITQRAGTQFVTQGYAIGLGLFAMAVCVVIDYRRLCENSLIIYLGVALLLLYVLFFGTTGGGARRWIGLGFFNLQPSEFMKIALLVILAVIGIVAAPVAWTFAMKDYQKSRIATFLDPEQDRQGAGYQQIQARITAGSGGLAGKGFRGGTQGQYKFLPVAHNDFIYSVLAEEQGFLGVLATLGLYLFVVLRSLEAARLSKDRHGAYLVVGLITGFTFQVVYNITMSAGLAPVKGLTLPLMSYGGSSVIATLASFGLILNVRMRRFTN
jgi:cell division protein FtsW (lipid II flippase)